MHDSLAAFNRGRFDPEAFAEQVLGVKLNPAQQRWFRLLRPEENGWQWRFKVIIHVAANQIGKTLGLAILILWACSYKRGVPTLLPDADEKEKKDWLSKPYTWFHLAPTQQQAYLPLNDIILLMEGAHPAQDIGKQHGLTCHWTKGLAEETKVEQYYRGLTFWNGATCQFRTTEDKAKALQGRRAAGISFDEAAFEDHLKAVKNEVLMMRLVAMDGPLLLVSTPNGINDFYEEVQEVTQHGEEKKWLDMPTPHNPEERVWLRDDSAVAWSVVDDNVGFGLSREAVNMMEENLDESTKEQQLRGAFLEPAEAFFVPVPQMLKAFRKGLPHLVAPIAGHTYVIAWDPSVASDPTAAVVLDITKEPWVGVALQHDKHPKGITQLIQDITATHLLYNSKEDERRLVPKSNAITAFDSTSMGGQIIRQQLSDIHPLRPVNFGGPSAKLKMLTNLRAALMKGQLILPDSWTAAKRELANYRLKDEKIVQDVVMALAIAADVASRGYSGVQRRPFDVSARVARAPLWR